MTDQRLSRRAFLMSSVQAARGSAIVLTLPAILSACREARQARIDEADFRILNEEDVVEFEAVAARIMPSDETPGAREAGVIYFMDNVLSDNRPETLTLLRDGMRELQTAAAIRFNVSYFHLLSEAQQDGLLTEIEDTPFFGTIRMLTLAGMFSLPEYGGNRDLQGYQVIGFDDRHAWAPPFGYYDADYMEKGE